MPREKKELAEQIIRYAASVEVDGGEVRLCTGSSRCGHDTNRLGETHGLSWWDFPLLCPFLRRPRHPAAFLLPFIDTLLFLCCRLPVAWCPPESQRYLMQQLTRQAWMHVNFYAAFFPMPAQKLT